MTTRPDDYTLTHVHREASGIQDPQADLLPGLVFSTLISIGNREHPKGQRHFLIRTVELRETEKVTQAVETNPHLTAIKDGPIIAIVDDIPQEEEVINQLLQLLNGCKPMDLTPIGERMFFPNGIQEPPCEPDSETPIFEAEIAPEEYIQNAVQEGRAEEVAPPAKRKPSPKKAASHKPQEAK